MLVVGLSSSGKSSVVHKMLPSTHIGEKAPTLGVTLQIMTSVSKRKKTATEWTIFDMSGDDTGRLLWPHYYPTTQALVFVIDVSNTSASHFSVLHAEIKQMLLKLAKNPVPICFFANKIDCREGADSPLRHSKVVDSAVSGTSGNQPYYGGGLGIAQFIQLLGLDEITDRKWSVL